MATRHKSKLCWPLLACSPHSQWYCDYHRCSVKFEWAVVHKVMDSRGSAVLADGSIITTHNSHVPKDAALACSLMDPKWVEQHAVFEGSLQHVIYAVCTHRACTQLCY